MDIGFIGLGKMGFNFIQNIRDHGHNVIGYDIDREARSRAEEKGFTIFSEVEELVANLKGRKVIWMMVPAGEITNNMIEKLTNILDKNDIIIDGGNSFYKNSEKNAELCWEKNIYLIDLGTSGGVTGARNGACLMAGGDPKACEYLEDVFKAVSVNDGYLYTGKSGSGHFLKMVHNGIEYGMMQSIAEGFDVLYNSKFKYDFEKVACNWNNGSVIRGWLMEIAQQQFKEYGELAEIAGVVEASGEAKWTVEAALEEEVPVPVIALSLMERNSSKMKDSFARKVVSVLRNGFGGHNMLKK